MLQIAFILPSLANYGPIIVARDLCTELKHLGCLCKVFYFDELESISFPVQTTRIAFREKVDLNQFHIVHSHGLRPDMFVHNNRKNIQGMCVSTMHNIIINEYRSSHNYIYAWFVQAVWIHYLKKHDALICLNKEMRDYYRGFFKDKTVSIVANGRTVDTSGEVSIEDQKLIKTLANRYKILGSACVVGKRKGLQQIINALPVLKDYAFILIGDGPELVHLQKLAKELGVEGRCLFLGKRIQAHRYYQYFNFFIMSSYAEGLPLSVLEAAALRVPVICSDIEVLKEMLSEAEASFFKLNDLDSFVSAVKQAWTKQHQYTENIYAAYQRRFTSSIMAANYLRAYNELINTSKSI